MASSSTAERGPPSPALGKAYAKRTLSKIYRQKIVLRLQIYNRRSYTQAFPKAGEGGTTAGFPEASEVELWGFSRSGG